jgi:quercetin dioxygenase-like cupin family protein
MNARRIVKWVLLSAGLAGVVSAVGVTPSGATPPAGLSQVPLARGTNVSHGTIPLQFGTDIAMTQITVEPGGSSGWHSHPGGAIVIVKQGAVTVYEAVGNECHIATHSAGQAFIERSGEVDQVVNEGSVPYVLVVTFPRVPQGAPARTDVANPGVCPGH